MKHTAPALAAVLVLSACSRSSDLASFASPEDPLARDVAITKLTFNQGVSHVLRDSRYGKPFGQPAVVQDREGLMRVHLDVGDDWEPRDLVAVLDFDGVRGPDRYVNTMFVEGDSFTGQLDSTFDFEVPADLVHEGSFFTVTLHEADLSEGEGELSEDASFDLRDEMWTVNETGAVHLRIIPVRYDADGSGRTPDVSPARLAELANAMRALYPVTDVTVEAADPLPWSSTIAPAGAGWQTLLTTISDMRASEPDLPENTYFYGMFEAAESEAAWCATGSCILGLSNFGVVPDTSTRASIGLGHSGQTSIETMLHEVGHAHGREHSPCGGAGGVDPGFPYSGASLGTWGWDINSGELVDPNENKDVMGYCSPVWVSDYTWHHLAQRTQALNGPVSMERSALDMRTWQRFAVETDGSVLPVGEPKVLPSPRGEIVQVKLLDRDGVRWADAHFYASDHLDGGTLLVATDAGWSPETRVVLD